MAGQIRAVIGLGNPGSRYATTRHNIGFLALDHLAQTEVGMAWKIKSRAEILQIRVAQDPLLLVKPQTYMNLSGEAVAEIMRFYQWDPTQLVVIHDDVDLAFGELRVKRGGGSAGHRGVRSIVNMLGSADFIRMRVGVGRPQTIEDTGVDLADWVLAKFTGSEQKVLPELVAGVADALMMLCQQGLDATQQSYNRNLVY